METANSRFALDHHDAAAKRIKRFSNVETSDRRRPVRIDRNTDASRGRSFHAVSLNGLIYWTNILAQYLNSVFSLLDVTIHGAHAHAQRTGSFDVSLFRSIGSKYFEHVR